MCRRARATATRGGRWIMGQRSVYAWAMYFNPGRRTNRMWVWHAPAFLTLAPYYRREECERMAKRLKADEVVPSAKGLGPAYGAGGKMFPNLCSWLFDTVYEDGTAKGVTRLQVQRKGDRCHVVLKDADSGLFVEAYHEDASDALTTLELLLGHEECPWQLDPFPLSSGTKKRKK